MHDTEEMEASLAQEYAAALTHKQKKDLLLEEFGEIQQELYDLVGGGDGGAS